MWIQVRTIDGKKTVRVDNLSKLTKIEVLREKLVEHFDVQTGDQRLFFRGKQLEDGYSLFDYDVGLNDLIQLMVRAKPAPLPLSESSSSSSTNNLNKAESKDTSEESVSDKENKEPDSDSETAQTSSSIVCLDNEEGNIYKVGDIIDARDPSMGAWFEASINEVIKNRNSGQSQPRSSARRSITGETSAIAASSAVQAESISAVSSDLICQSREDGENNNDIKENPSADEKAVLQRDNTSVPMLTDNCDETDGASHPAAEKLQHIESSTVLSPKKINTSKENAAADAAVSSAGRSLFKKDVSDDLKKQGILCETTVSDGFIYKVIFDGYEDDVVELSSESIRPRARHLIPFASVKEGQKIMANYNYDDPTVRGFWYDCLVTRKKDTRTQKELYATVYIGADLAPLENCKLLFPNELFEIEVPGTQLTEKDVQMDPSASPAKRQNKPECDHCKDNPRRKCKHCACCVCGGKNDPDRQLMCDECNQAYHLDCLNPPLASVPDIDDWYCPDCKQDENEVVKAGEKLKESKKKSKMASANSSSSRDWGKGMACVGRTKQCTIVPSNHYGPVPGVEVGTLWKFRVQVSEAGIHRPHVAGIHGREEDGAYSLVLSGGYEDDADNGDEFYYTGSGGRDLSGNKRTAEQSCDQKLTRMNRALAKNCNAAINNKNGAEAKDWRGGKPVRVVRNCKGRKHSDYAPEEGNRYDGIYKVVKYWSEKGKSGFLVWRYLLRRDDPASAPWTKDGKKRIQKLGLEMQYPEGYLESQAEKEKSAGISEESEEDPSPKKRGRKRKAESPQGQKDVKKAKTEVFKISKDVMKLIREDVVNKKLWDVALGHVSEGKQRFLQQLEQAFLCICCQEVVYKPVTLECLHNICKPCIKRSFKAEVYSCPACRADIAKDSSLPTNTTLTKALNHFYPGYEAGRE